MAYLLFVSTMLFIYLRPFSLPIWLSAVIFAFLAYLLDVVSFSDIKFVFSIVTDSTVALLALILLSISFDKLGFFKHLASFIAFKRISSFSFFILLSILASLIAIIFANDGAILVLTPIIYRLFSHYKNENFSPLLVFLLCVSFLSDFASNLLPFSNLTNIITVKMFSLNFFDFVLFMFLPQIFAIISFMFLAYIIFKRYLPKYLCFDKNELLNTSKKDILFCYFVVFLLFFSVFIASKFNLELYFILFIISLLSLFYAFIRGSMSFFSLVKEAPFSVIPFSLALFVVVFGLKNADLLSFMQDIFGYLSDSNLFFQIFYVGIFSSLASSLINNLPMTFLGNMAIDSFALEQNHKIFLAYSHLLACNIGSKITPIGSLATLLWLYSLSLYDLRISFFRYMAFSFLITFFVLFAALFGLCLTVAIVY